MTVIHSEATTATRLVRTTDRAAATLGLQHGRVLLKRDPKRATIMIGVGALDRGGSLARSFVHGVLFALWATVDRLGAALDGHHLRTPGAYPFTSGVASSRLLVLGLCFASTHVSRFMGYYQGI
jgi:hypothetical protein